MTDERLLESLKGLGLQASIEADSPDKIKIRGFISRSIAERLFELLDVSAKDIIKAIVQREELIGCPRGSL